MGLGSFRKSASSRPPVIPGNSATNRARVSADRPPPVQRPPTQPPISNPALVRARAAEGPAPGPSRRPPLNVNQVPNRIQKVAPEAAGPSHSRRPAPPSNANQVPKRPSTAAAAPRNSDVVAEAGASRRPTPAQKPSAKNSATVPGPVNRADGAVAGTSRPPPPAPKAAKNNAAAAPLNPDDGAVAGPSRPTNHVPVAPAPAVAPPPLNPNDGGMAPAPAIAPPPLNPNDGAVAPAPAVAPSPLNPNDGAVARPSGGPPPPPPSRPVIYVTEPRYRTKSLIDLEDYFKILERTVQHPTVRTHFRYSTYSQNAAAFGATRLRPYDVLTSAAALQAAVRPRLEVDRSVPSTVSRIELKLEAEAEECTHITKTSLLNVVNVESKNIFAYLKALQSKMHKLIKRAKKTKKSQNWRQHEYGLGQLGGFCREIHNIMFNTLPGTKVYAATATIGCPPVVDLLRNINVFHILVSRPFVIPTCPAEQQGVNARIKIQASYDSIMDAFHRLGRPGFLGNWTDLKHCDPKVLASDDIESILVTYMDVYSKLCTLTADLAEVYRTFIFSDNVQKTYLVKYLRAFPVDDYQKVLNNLYELSQRLQNVHQLWAQICYLVGQGAKLFCPPRRYPPILLPVVEGTLWRSTVSNYRRSMSFPLGKVKYMPTPVISSGSPSLDTLFTLKAPQTFTPARHQPSAESVMLFPEISDVHINRCDNLPCVPRPKSQECKPSVSLNLDEIRSRGSSPLMFQFFPKSDPGLNEYN